MSKITRNGTAYTFGYDTNGSMTAGFDFSRPGTAATRNITYNADRMPVAINRGGVVTTLEYDGAGTRSRKIAGANTTVYVGDHYKVSNGVAVKYIFGGDLRIAKITGSTVTYFHKDHLGSSVLMTDVAGKPVSNTATSYKPFGEDRVYSALDTKDYKYTDQEYDSEAGLYNYNARMYVPAIGVFVSADIFVQNYSNPQALNRYAYCNNNPLMYTDPTGHFGTWNMEVPVQPFVDTAIAFNAAFTGNYDYDYDRNYFNNYGSNLTGITGSVILPSTGSKTGTITVTITNGNTLRNDLGSGSSFSGSGTLVASAAATPIGAPGLLLVTPPVCFPGTAENNQSTKALTQIINGWLWLIDPRPLINDTYDAIMEARCPVGKDRVAEIIDYVNSKPGYPTPPNEYCPKVKQAIDALNVVIKYRYDDIKNNDKIWDVLNAESKATHLRYIHVILEPARDTLVKIYRNYCMP